LILYSYKILFVRHYRTTRSPELDGASIFFISPLNPPMGDFDCVLLG